MTRIYVIDVGNELRAEDVSSWRGVGATRFEVFRAEAIRSFTSSAEPPALVLVYGDDARGTLLISRIAAVWPDTPLAMCSTAPSVPGAIAAIRSGAMDYQTAPLSREAIDSLLRRIESTGQPRTPTADPADRDEPKQLIGCSAPIRRLRQQIEAIAPHDVTVLIHGEVGTGKELVARMIHQSSRRAAAPLIVLNCSAIVPSLCEGELFGYEKGAFTGARTARVGAFEAAHKGTLFFDQIQELPLAIQPKLLRVLENRTYARLGSTRAMSVDARVIAAADGALDEAVRAGRFRRDLYYRLNVVKLSVPPLRERVEDVPLLSEHFLQRFARRFGKRAGIISQEALGRLSRHSWDGNVRELGNVIERAVIASRGRVITSRELGRDFAGSEERAAAAPSEPRELVSLAELERNQIRQVLDMVGGHHGRALKALGLSRSTFYRRLSELSIDNAAAECAAIPT